MTVVIRNVHTLVWNILPALYQCSGHFPHCIDRARARGVNVWKLVSLDIRDGFPIPAQVKKVAAHRVCISPRLSPMGRVGTWSLEKVLHKTTIFHFRLSVCILSELFKRRPVPNRDHATFRPDKTMTFQDMK
jgi:hypothetical protein